MKFRLKSWMPRGLYGRAALILIVPIVAIQLVVSIIFIQRHYEGVTRQLSRGAMIELRFVLAEVAAAPDSASALARARALGTPLGMEVTLPATDPAPETEKRDFWDWSGRAMIATLEEGVTAIDGVDLQRDPRQVYLWLTTPYGPMLVVMSRGRFAVSNPHQLLVVMLIASIVMTAVAILFLRNQMVPITRLASAAEAFGKGQMVPYRPRGASEVRAAGAAFLDMRSRIERQIEQRTRMLSGVSHDLRTPLTRLKLGLAFLPEGDETEALQRDVADMERMVDEFLAFVRGEAGEETEETDMRALVGQAVDNAVRMGLVVTLAGVEGDGGGTKMKIRPQAVMRALENLINNAVRHGTQAEISLALTDRTCRITVEDDGPGIPRERREEAVQPFARLDAARDPNHGGVGLGLSITADVARAHGGQLRLGDSARLGGLKADLVLAR
jgi:two-component system, OmpR family, osmolarity sensor histidine kinase EnvZ